MATLDDQLTELETLSNADLKDRWAKLTGRPAPKVSEAMLRLALAYELQAKVLGAISRETRQPLDQIAAAKTHTKDLRPGMRLVREFGGKVHMVTVGDHGQIIWKDCEWR